MQIRSAQIKRVTKETQIALKLVIDGYRRGGWKMVDRMDEDPPRSTREVLHPSEYFARLGNGPLTSARGETRTRRGSTTCGAGITTRAAGGS